SSFLRRSADDDDSTERPLVANVDLMVIVTALADPEPRGGMVDRCLVAAYVAGIDTLLVLTKADLKGPADFLHSYAPLGVDHVVTRVRDDGGLDGLAELQQRLEGRISVLIGHSGVGKSTLLNALVPGTSRATGAVNETTGRGRHTSSSALALQLPHTGAWVIDTPGVRSFGLGHVVADELLEAFPDLAGLAEQCPRGRPRLCSRRAGRAGRGGYRGADPAGLLPAAGRRAAPQRSVGRLSRTAPSRCPTVAAGHFRLGPCPAAMPTICASPMSWPMPSI